MTEIRKLDDILAELNKARQVKDLAQSKLNAAKAVTDALEQELLVTMEKVGTDKASGSGLTVSISRSMVPTVEDWNEFVKYIARKKAFHLVERRVHTKAWREECASLRDKKVPGVKEFERIGLSITAT